MPRIKPKLQCENNDGMNQHTAQMQVMLGDITALNVDAIVNAANERLLHGGGIAAIIAQAGGPAIDQESQAWVKGHGPVPHPARNAHKRRQRNDGRHGRQLCKHCGGSCEIRL